MIAPGANARVYLACGVTDMRKGIIGLAAKAQEELKTERPFGGALRFPRSPGRSDQTFALGWTGILPLLQSSGEGPLSLAIARRRIRASHGGATFDVVGRHRLAPSGVERAAGAGCVIFPGGQRLSAVLAWRVAIYFENGMVTETLPDDPAMLKAMIIAQQAETVRLQASVRAYETLIQALKIRIAKLQRQKFGPSSEKIHARSKVGADARRSRSGDCGGRRVRHDG